MNSILEIKIKPRYKILIVMAYDILTIAASFFLSFSLRLGEIFPSPFYQQYFWNILLISTIIQFFCLYFIGVYKTIWRFSSLPDLARILKGVGVAIPVNVLFLFIITRLENIPRSLFFIDALLLVIGLGGGRFAYRVISDKQKHFHLSISNFTKVLLIGAGRGGEKILREIKNDPALQLYIVGIIDDDPEKKGKTLHGIKILGHTEEILAIAKKTSAKKAFIAIPSASGQEIKGIVQKCREANLEIKTLPKSSEIFHGQIEYSQLRALKPEDLLGRESVQLDTDKMRDMIQGKIVLVTGAGGSIGSELCLQILKLKPKKLILFELTELFLYQLEPKLVTQDELNQIIPLIGDVRNKKSLERVFQQHKPEVIFHAAAYKHVPMMEKNPTEAINTNIFGSKNVAELALKYRSEKFVLISTDKAVNPTNIMGASKRIAEMICQSLNNKGFTKFISLRFGNVLGSSGSVIPLFKKQIELGGPITVTHPEIRRYFMSIPEACQLVIQAGSFGNGGEIFVLDMGEPIYIKDLAKEMIQLAGLKEKDIGIIYTGLRPGEKLYEELFSQKEHFLPTKHSKVKVAQAQNLPDDFINSIENLKNDIYSLDTAEIKSSFKRIVPEYQTESNDLHSQSAFIH